MKRSCTLLLFLAVASSAVGQEPADKTEKLLGTWRPVSGELSGQKVPDVVLKATQMVLGEGTYVVTVGDSVDKGTWKVDATTEPKNLDIVGTDGPNKGKTLLAIYRFDGDRLTVCYDLLGKQRPGAFETRQTQPYYLVTYERKSEQHGSVSKPSGRQHVGWALPTNRMTLWWAVPTLRFYLGLL